MASILSSIMSYSYRIPIPLRRCREPFLIFSRNRVLNSFSMSMQFHTRNWNYNRPVHHLFHTNVTSRKQHDFPDDKNLQMQQLALHLISLESASNYRGFPPTESMNFDHAHRKLMKDAVRVIRYFSDTNHCYDSLSLIDKAQSTWIKNNISHPLTLSQQQISGAHTAYSILKQVLLPYILMNQQQFRLWASGNWNEVTILIDLCYATIVSLSCTTKSKVPTENFCHGEMAEELLRMLFQCLYIPRNISPTSTLSHRKHTSLENIQYIQSRLIHACNASINVWAQIASSNHLDASMSKEAALHAERLLLEMASTLRNETNLNNDPLQMNEVLLGNLVRPDIVSFNTVIKAWANYGRAYHHSLMAVDDTTRRSSSIFPKMTSEKSGLDLDQHQYNLNARNTNKERDEHTSSSLAAERAEAILKLLEDMADENHSFICPDSRSYDNVIEAWAKISQVPEAPLRATAILEKMIDRYYTAQSENLPTGIFQMHSMTKNPPPFPNKYTFTACLKSWLFSKDPQSVAKMENLLEKMNQLVAQGFDSCRPDIITYNVLFTKYAKRLNANADRLKLLLKQTSTSSLDKDSDVRKTIGRLMVEQNKICLTMEDLYRNVSGIHKSGDETVAVSINNDDKQGSFDSRSIQPDRITFGTILYSWITHAQSLNLVRTSYDKDKYNQQLLDCAVVMEKILDEFAHHQPNQNEKHQSSGRTVKALNVTTTKEIIDIYIAVGDYERAYRLFAKVVGLLKRGIILEGRNISLIASHLTDVLGAQCQRSVSTSEWACLSSYIESILSQTEMIQSPTTDMYNRLLKLYAKRMAITKDTESLNMLLERSEKIYQAMEVREGTLKPDIYTYSYMFQIIAKSDPMYAADRALNFLRQVLSKRRHDADSVLDIVSFNTILNLLQLSRSDENLRKSEKMLQDLEMGVIDLGQDSFVKVKIEPDRITYSTVMSALSHLPRSAPKVQQIFDRLQARYQHTISNGDVEFAKQLAPDITCFNILIGSWLRSRSRHGFNKAYELLHHLELQDIVDVSTYNMMMHICLSHGDDASASELKDRMDKYSKSRGRLMTPTDFTFSAILSMKTHSKDPSSSTESEQLLRERETRSFLDPSIKLTGFSYNTVIKKYISSAENGWIDNATNVMNSMIQRHRMLGEEELPAKQILVAANTILKGIRDSGMEGAAARADNFLHSTKEKLAQINLHLDSYSYSLCMDTWAISKQPIGPMKTFDLLNELVSQYNEGDIESAAFLSDVNSFNLVLKACSLCTPLNVEKSYQTDIETAESSSLPIALQTFSLLQKNPYKVKPNHATYSYMIDIASSLLDVDSRRDSLIEKLFHTCCREGHLSSFVLSTLERCGSTNLLAKMNVQNRLKIQDYPLEFRRNVHPQVSKGSFNK